jgi:hypothetical protein
MPAAADMLMPLLRSCTRPVGVSHKLHELPPTKLGSLRTNVTLKFHMARKWNFYTWKVLFPLWILGGLTFKLFEVPVDDTDWRNTRVFTFVTATFAMLFVVSRMLPTTDYLTKMDKFVVSLLTCLLTDRAPTPHTQHTSREH